MITNISASVNPYKTNFYSISIIKKSNISPAFEGRKKQQSYDEFTKNKFISLFSDKLSLSGKRMNENYDRLEKKLFNANCPLCDMAEIKIKEVPRLENVDLIRCRNGKPYTGIIIERDKKNNLLKFYETVKGLYQFATIISHDKSYSASFDYKNAEVCANNSVDNNGKKEQITLCSKMVAPTKYKISILRKLPTLLIFENHNINICNSNETKKIDNIVRKCFNNKLNFEEDIMPIY